jgi:hypothetical protein
MSRKTDQWNGLLAGAFYVGGAMVVEAISANQYALDQ